PDLCRHAAEPLERVQIVKALVQEYSASFPLPGGPPSSARVVGLGAIPISNDPIDANEFTKFSPLDQFLNFQVARLRAELEHRRENQLWVALMRADQLFRVGLVGGDGFLNHQMHSTLESGYSKRCVGIVRRGD